MESGGRRMTLDKDHIWLRSTRIHRRRQTLSHPSDEVGCVRGVGAGAIELVVRLRVCGSVLDWWMMLPYKAEKIILGSCTNTSSLLASFPTHPGFPSPPSYHASLISHLHTSQAHSVGPFPKVWQTKHGSVSALVHTLLLWRSRQVDSSTEGTFPLSTIFSCAGFYAWVAYKMLQPSSLLGLFLLHCPSILFSIN